MKYADSSANKGKSNHHIGLTKDLTNLIKGNTSYLHDEEHCSGIDGSNVKDALYNEEPFKNANHFDHAKSIGCSDLSHREAPFEPTSNIIDGNVTEIDSAAQHVEIRDMSDKEIEEATNQCVKHPNSPTILGSDDQDKSLLPDTTGLDHPHVERQEKSPEFMSSIRIDGKEIHLSNEDSDSKHSTLLDCDYS